MPAPDSVTLAALPFDVVPGEVAGNLERVLAGVEEAAAAGARLLLLPEKWTTSFLPSFPAAIRRESDAALARVHARAAELGVIVVGSAPGGSGEKPFNELHLLGAAGDLRPWRKRVLFSPTGENAQNEAGKGLPPVLDTGAGRLGTVICYELRFPELTRGFFHEQADLLLVPAQWPHPRTMVFERLSVARALENQCFVLACNRAGVASLGLGQPVLEFPGTAMLVDPLGEIAARVDGGSLLIAQADYAFAREVRERVPCLRDARKAGLA